MVAELVGGTTAWDMPGVVEDAGVCPVVELVGVCVAEL